MRSVREHRLILAARTIGGLVAIVGMVVMVGWTFDLVVLTSIAPSYVTMKANTALGFVLAGCLLILATIRGKDADARRRMALLARIVATVVAAMGAVTLCEYLLDIDVGIDQLLFLDPATAQTSNPGRMSPATAFAFLLIGGAFWLLDVETRRGLRPAQWLALCVFAVGYVAVMGYLYDVQSLYRIAAFTAVAIHTAVLFVLLALGILAARPMQGFMRAVVDDGPGGVLLRWLLPVAMIAPPLFDWLQVESFPDRTVQFDVVVIALFNIVVLVALVWWLAAAIRKAEHARLAAEADAITGVERLGVALEAAGGGAWDWDLNTNIAWWSPEMYELWGVAPGTVMQLDNSLAAVFEPDRDVVRQAVEAAIATRSPYRCEFRISDGGGERWMASRGRVVFDRGGAPVRLVGISFDITAQKRGERDLRLVNEALERSNLELKRFAHVASHDLQTPMRSVASFAELLHKKYADRLDEQGLDWLQRIVQSVNHLQVLVRDLLQYARLDSQGKPFAEVDLNEIYEHVVLLLDAAIRESHAAVTCDPLPKVMGDATQLTELLLNLIGNAVKYRGNDAPRVHVAVQRNADAWQVAVRDNGIGIASRHHERIFEMFARLHGQQQYPGTGVGLAICRRVVQRHGGKIWVESTPGKGSAFYFTLPERLSAAA